MRVLALQNFDNTGLGQLSTALEAAGVAVDLVRLDLGQALPETVGDYDGLIVLGGGQNALDDAGSPYFPALLDLVRRFAAQDRSVLGICLGAQLMARAFEAENRIGGASEFGWHEVALTPAGTADPLTGVLPERFPVFQWHDDTFTLPEGAAHLAGNAAAPTQAFRVGRAAYGVQFHFEADRALVRHWSETLAADIARHQPGWESRRADDEAQFGANADRAGALLAQAWIATLRP